MPLLEIHPLDSMNTRSKSSLSFVQQTFPAPAVERAEVRVRLHLNPLMLQSDEVESQTVVHYMGEDMPLHAALRQVMESCLSLWSQADYSSPDAFRNEALDILDRLQREGEQLVLQALKRPLQARAIARVGLMGINFSRTLTAIFEALLRYPAQKSCTAKPTRVDVNIEWAVSGLAEWRVPGEFAFEQAAGAPDTRDRHITAFYATDRNGRSQISLKQIANIFLLDERVVAEIERSAHTALRNDYVESGDAPDSTCSELAGV